MAKYDEWFAVDVQKRAAAVRSRPLAVTLKELLANSLDAGAKNIELTCQPAEGTRRDNAGLRAFDVICVDDGAGCDNPDILRRIGSSTSDLHAETRGRFGQGLIDVLAIATLAVIHTLKQRLTFDSKGCQISTIKNAVNGMRFEGQVRHDGEGFDDFAEYFSSVVLPDGVSVIVNGEVIDQRKAVKSISDIKLQTVIFDQQSGRVRRHSRVTMVETHKQLGDSPMIHELGIPVDEAPWELPFDINVLQKTPLDVERNMLPAKYKANLISQLVGPMSDEYQRHIAEHDDAPAEIKNDRENAARLSTDAQTTLVKTITGAEPDQIVRRDPFDSDDMSESQELESEGYAPVNRGSLPAGVSELLKDAPTVATTHDAVCKAHFRASSNFPPITERQRQCMAAIEEIASALVGKPIRCERVRGGNVAAAYEDCKISLNIDQRFIWIDPLGEQTLGLIIHECSHEKVSGHAEDFRKECERMGGRLARWVGDHADQWAAFQSKLYAASASSAAAATN